MKPEWKDAPDWANYLAMDEDGQWWWHELKPTCSYGTFNSDGLSCTADVEGWADTLESRPKGDEQ